METFTRFMELPAELRFQVWELAIRPLHLPSVHYLAVDYDKNDKKYFTMLPVDRHPHRHLLETIPLVGVDAGLWTACKESRDVVKNAFVRRFTRSPDSGPGTAPVVFGTRRYRQLAMDHNGHSRADLSARTYLSTHAWTADASIGVLPQRDLTVFQEYDWNTWNVNKVIRDLGSTKWGLGVAFDEPIGFEFQASWSFDYDMFLGFQATRQGREYTAAKLKEMMQDKGPRALCLSLLMAGYKGRIKSKIYLIQYGMSQKPTFDHHRKNRSTFSGCGFTLIQTFRNEIESLKYSPMEIQEVHDGCKTMTAWDFEGTVHIMFQRLFGFSDSRNRIRQVPFPMHTEVLVCEMSEH